MAITSSRDHVCWYASRLPHVAESARFALRMAAVVLLLHIAIGAAVAQQGTSSAPPSDLPDEITAVPNRPTFSTTAETTQRGVLEIEYGFEAADGLQDINGLVKFGLAKDLELRFGNDPIIRQRGVAGFGDVSAGLKLRVHSESRLAPTVSLLYAATLPTASSGVGMNALGHAATLLLSKDLGKHHFDINEGVQFFDSTIPGGVWRHQYFSALAYSHPVWTSSGLTAEVAGFSRLDASLPASMTVLAAFTHNFSSRLVVDAGAYCAAFGQLPRVVVFSGVTYSVADLYPRHRTRAGTHPQSK